MRQMRQIKTDFEVKICFYPFYPFHPYPIVISVTNFRKTQFSTTTFVMTASGLSKLSELVANTKYTPEAARRPR